MLKFEWDERKNRANVAKHGVSFETASEVFLDPLSLTISDPDHSRDEDRFVTIGNTDAGGVVVVSHPDGEGRIRIISARPATLRERRNYETS